MCYQSLHIIIFSNVCLCVYIYISESRSFAKLHNLNFFVVCCLLFLGGKWQVMLKSISGKHWYAGRAACDE